jgi:3-dehydroquinate synthase
MAPPTWGYTVSDDLHKVVALYCPQICLENRGLTAQSEPMSLIEWTIPVSFRHRVHFTRDVFGPGHPLLKDVLGKDAGDRPSKALVVLDESLHRAQPELVRRIEACFAASGLLLVCPPMILEGGERVKNSYFHVSEIQSHIDRYHIDRHSYVLAVGGGALLDVAGLAAATAHRGVRLVRFPSTVLSQADSGVGVKNGINAFGKKNFIGTFAVPFAVINDFDLLARLPAREKRAGYAEAVKVALVRDREFFEALERDADKLRALEPAAIEHLIRRCAEIHLNHIATSGDPFEMGSARPLDFGHWSAHKLEQLSNYEIRHGEAVAIGIALDTVYSRNVGPLEAASADRVLALLERLGFDLFANELLHADSDGDLVVLRGLEEFREHLGGDLTVTLLKAIGHGFEVRQMDRAQVLAALQELQTRHLKKTPGG